ncbi:MAG: bifunctional 4-hydroxy-2-oxoglutarate aldolase/2-dehydro-3-deoxy-phosphogluconate aldolase [Ignavibacteriales bacterium]|nr:bifunctional 4-hydroxy-2-oxoglutarate aldolase/2-dehydro-3-deoxy-phosphogluconate aldolase [Ignavibacteriales bacterium]MCB9211175.1 bifunctional 4-hydroxy-2-oxoglutarate aldolase/2-dehydro-3-deoxy-phosphogluconate aldolase [Ignavibacteriales bacterium]
MTREETRQSILERKVLSVVRMKNPAQLIPVINALKEGGVTGIELTMTIPNAIEAIRTANEEFGDSILLGVGSVIDPQTALDAIEAGAKFVVSPIYKRDVVDAVLSKNIVVSPGCFSPTEIQIAYEQGADFIKIFPADNLGMSFIKSIKAPLPHLKVIPTGGVNLENAIDWINAGASAVGLGSALVDIKAIETENYAKLTDNAKKLCANLGIN